MYLREIAQAPVMKLICLLNMHNPALAEAELCSLLDARVVQRSSDVLVVDASFPERSRRLAFTRVVCEHWWECAQAKLWAQLDSFAWKKAVQGTIAVATHQSKISPVQIADRLWHWLENPQADLRNPQTAIHFFFTGSRVLCGKLLWKQNENFGLRAPRNRPATRPISCNPRLSRAMVNLTAAPEKSRILDPFCGTGGVLLEAGLMGLHPAGMDISSEVVKDAIINCDHYRIEASIRMGDATHLYAPEKYVVADLPYGRQSGLKTSAELQELYASFLDRLQNFLRVRAVLSFPGSINVSRLLKDTSLKLVASFDDYVHSSLSRKIVVLEPK
jgi:tRNA (guanine10-N2)-dimethyltransferase